MNHLIKKIFLIIGENKTNVYSTQYALLFQNIGVFSIVKWDIFGYNREKHYETHY